jgi:glycosyltransferase involved in cell wall biosynthesis
LSDAPLRIVWFGSYSKGPGYPRAETLIDGLRAAGHDVVEVHAPLFAGADARVAAGAGGGLLGTAWRQLVAAVRLGRAWFRVGDHNVVVVGNGGIADVLIARFLQNVDRRPLVMDAFIPLYDTVVRDRGLASPESLRARVLLRLERGSARAADLVLADTAANASLLADDLGIDLEKTATVAVSQADPGEPAPLPEGGELRVFLVASYIPLHGVDVVVEAARLLGGDGVAIEIVGTGQELERIARRADGVAGLELVPRFVPPDEIASRLRASHVGLGVFGDTEKAARVVPLKAALVQSHGRALVTRDGPAANEAFGEDGSAALVPPADPDALAAVLRRLRDDRTELERLAAAGRRSYEQRFAPDAVARSLLDALSSAGLVD